MNIAIFYYSGTGNTKYGLERLKTFLSNNKHTCKLISITEDNNLIPEQNNYDLYGFASPVYHGFPAQIMIDFISRLPLYDTELPAFTILCPCFNLFNIGFWGAKEHFSDMLASKNIKVISESGFFGEASHPMIRKFFLGKLFSLLGRPFLSKGRPDYRDEIMLKSFSDSIESRFLDYKSGKKIKLDHSSIRRSVSSKIIRPFVEKCNENYLLKFVDKEKCTKCGICSKNCPVNAIKIEDFPGFGNECFNCQNCVNLCPQNAIHYKITRKINNYKGKALSGSV